MFTNAGDHAGLLCDSRPDPTPRSNVLRGAPDLKSSAPRPASALPDTVVPLAEQGRQLKGAARRPCATPSNGPQT